MADRNTSLNVDVTATDRASGPLRDVAKLTDEIEGEHVANVKVDDQADDELREIRSKLDSLTREDRIVALKLTAANLESEVRSAERALGRLDKYDQEQINVRIEARDNASGRLDAVRRELRELDGDSASVRVDVKGDGGVADSGGFGGLAGALGVGGLIAGLSAASQEAINTSLQVQAIANRTGAPLEDVSRLVTVFRDSGVEASDLADILYNVNGVLRDNPELADKLGVKIGQNTTLVDIFLQAVAGVETKFTNVGDAAVAASQLFGEEGVRQIDIVTARVGDLEAAMAGVSDNRVIDPEDVERARELNEEAVKLKGHLEAIALAVLPIVNDTLGGARGYFGAVSDLGAKYYNEHNPIPISYGGLTPAGISAGIQSGSIPRDAFPNLTDEAFAALASPTNVTINNPPGTPAVIVDTVDRYAQRNGSRTGVHYR